MIKLYDGGAFLINGKDIVPEKDASGAAAAAGRNLDKEEARKGTIAYGILKAHNTSDNMDKLKIKFDAMASHDITFVGIVQTAKASGMKEFPIQIGRASCRERV